MPFCPPPPILNRVKKGDRTGSTHTKIVSSFIFYSKAGADKNLSNSSGITCNVLPGVTWALDKRVMLEMLENVSNS